VSMILIPSERHHQSAEADELKTACTNKPFKKHSGERSIPVAICQERRKAQPASFGSSMALFGQSSRGWKDDLLFMGYLSG